MNLLQLLNTHGSARFTLKSPLVLEIHHETSPPRTREVSFDTQRELEDYLHDLAWVILQMSANYHAKQAEEHAKLQGEALMEFNLLFGTP